MLKCPIQLFCLGFSPSSPFLIFVDDLALLVRRDKDPVVFFAGPPLAVKALSVFHEGVRSSLLPAFTFFTRLWLVELFSRVFNPLSILVFRPAFFFIVFCRPRTALAPFPAFFPAVYYLGARRNVLKTSESSCAVTPSPRFVMLTFMKGTLNCLPASLVRLLFPCSHPRTCYLDHPYPGTVDSVTAVPSYTRLAFFSTAPFP